MRGSAFSPTGTSISRPFAGISPPALKPSKIATTMTTIRRTSKSLPQRTKSHGRKRLADKESGPRIVVVRVLHGMRDEWFAYRQT